MQFSTDILASQVVEQAEFEEFEQMSSRAKGGAFQLFQRHHDDLAKVILPNGIITLSPELAGELLHCKLKPH